MEAGDFDGGLRPPFTVGGVQASCRLPRVQELIELWLYIGGFAEAAF
jgi:hypothetical protein